MNVLIIDNYDSFTGNLEHLVATTVGQRPEIISYGNLDSEPVVGRDLIIISAGPGKPTDYPRYSDVLSSVTPVLGVCLGMQIINEYFGGTTVTLPGCIHGRTDTITIEDHRFVVARYHSLCCRQIGEGVEVFGTNYYGVPMALRHRSRPIMGYQFHPESFLTPEGPYFVNYAIENLCIALAR